MRKLFFFFLVAFFAFTIRVGYASKADIDAEVSSYIEIFGSGNFQQQRRAMDKLQWSGHSTAKLYDVISNELQRSKDAKDKPSKEKAAWFAKTLALSGNEKYRSVLQSVSESAGSKKVKKNAAIALGRLDVYQQWNPVIAKGLQEAPAGRLEQARVRNMLAAADYGLLRMGAKRVYHGHKQDSELVDLAKQRLQKEWPTVQSGNADQVDALAWLIRVLAETGERLHKPLLDDIAANAADKKVRKYATKYASYLE